MTTAIELPMPARPWKAKPQFQDYGGMLVPPRGGARVPFVGQGNRWGVEFSELPDFDGDLAAAMAAARTEHVDTKAPVIVDWPISPNLNQSYGATKVNGANQLGRLLICDGFSVRNIKRGRWLSYVADGTNFIHQVARDATADASGNVTLQLTPAIRISPADNAEINTVRPRIEGDIAGADWEESMSEWTTFPAFQIIERR